MKRVVIYSDGASKGNPGDAGIGVVISDTEGNVLREIADYIGKQTNNVAEYSALIRGLEEAADLGATQVDICVDSELLARQLTGVYKVKAPNLKPLFEELVTLLRVFERATVTHVVREYNKRADELANEGVKRHKNAQIKPAPAALPKKAGQGKLEF
jgi:ribonuclease HI